MSKEIVIPTTQELEKKWDVFSLIFQNSHEPLTIPFCNILISNLNLTCKKDAIPKSILEVGCGAGAGTDLCLFFKHPSTQLTSTDLSSEMINLTRSRLHMNTEEDKNRNFKLIKADSENLPFLDATFDRYFANFCLHLVNDPDRMLRETYRVLENDGIAAFSVWGRVENCNKFTIISEVAAELKIPTGPVSNDNKQIRTSFHLSDVEKLKSMAKNAGFSQVLGGYTTCNDLSYSGSDFVSSNFTTPDLVEKGKNMDPQLFAQWKKKVEEYVDNLYRQGKFVSFEAAYIICKK